MSHDKECIQCQLFKIQIERLQRENRRLKNTLNQVNLLCRQVIELSGKAIESGGLSKVQWSFHKSAFQIAERILKLIGREL